MTSKRGPYSSERQRERRRRILKVAGVQLQKHGLDALTMQSIAEVSEVSTKTLYNLFGSRDLLLLEAASDRLVDLETSSELNSIEAGIPRLLAFTIGTMAQFEEMPKYARAVIAIVMRASMDEETAYQNLTPVQRFAHSSLVIADKQGELREGIDLLELSYVIAANLWGVVMLWEKGLLQLEQLKTHVALSHSLTLAPLCVGERKLEMEARLEKLLNNRSAPTVKKSKKEKAAVKLVSNNKR